MSVWTANQSKSDLRAAALARRAALTRQERGAAAQAIAEQTFPLRMNEGLVVAGYSPIRGEMDPAPLMQKLARQGAALALPAVVAREQPLLFREWNPDVALVRGQFDILEPSSDAPVVRPDIILVPLAAFDRGGHRVGYGAGYYDRTLRELQA